MLRHVVLLQLRPDTGTAQVEAIVDALGSLPDVIESIADYQIGVDHGMAPDNAHVAVIADFADTAAWQRYQDHPAHERVLTELIKPVLASRSATQFAI